jgi:outer membrane protein OmpA-like peptidoglycan-associated protein
MVVTVVVGCAPRAYFGVENKAAGVPSEFAQTEAAIAKAERSAGARNCPDTIKEAKELARKAVETYWACRTAEAMDMLAMARSLAMTAEACRGTMAAPPPPPAGQCLVKLQDTNFAFDSAEITPGGKAIIDAYVDIFRTEPKFRVEIGGHTDDVGPEDYNQQLSEKRAKSVADYLVSQGVSRDRIARVIGYGETKPMVPNDSPYNRARNRRVEVLVCE